MPPNGRYKGCPSPQAEDSHFRSRLRSPPSEEKGDPEEQYHSRSGRLKLGLRSLALAAMVWGRESTTRAIRTWTWFVKVLLVRVASRKAESPTTSSTREAEQDKEIPLEEYPKRCGRTITETRSLPEEVQVISLRRGPGKGTTPEPNAGPRGHRPRYSEYTPLITTRETILRERTGDEF